MRKETDIYSEQELREMSEAYFEGAVSQQQIQILVRLAALHTEGKIDINDSQLAGDLATIYAVENYARTAIRSLEKRIPGDLEMRLDRHISMLASRSKSRWKWFKIGSAAACVALLITAGVHTVLHNHTSESPHRTPTIYIAGIRETAQPGSLPQNVNLTASRAAAVNPQNPVIIRVSPHPRSREISPGINPANPIEPPLHIVLPNQLSDTSVPYVCGVIDMPSRLDPSPYSIMTETRTNVAELIASPFVAISQSLENMMEALDIVNGTLYNANQTASSLSEEFLHTSVASLREI